MKPGFDCIGIGCGAIIVNSKNEVLLLKRSAALANEPNCWARPGGTVEFGETIEEALVREVKEEVGIDVRVIRFLEMTQVIDKKEGRHWIALGFLAEHVAGEVRNCEPAKHSAVQWFSLDALPKKLAPYAHNGIDAYLKLRQDGLLE